ncbi:hypothetical protein L2E82_30529 [Cichorium intybus]|uniref:Uncharacterized protein n=1 Tax=Cichorium intybus TaxID=13427 RepID=A0ACB9D0T9_CICIN|nr:hypothetical protein L2E82_30529 [Cichorium intybus]
MIPIETFLCSVSKSVRVEPVPEQAAVLPEESEREVVFSPPENVEVADVAAAAEEPELEPVAEVVDEVQEASQLVVESNTKIEEVTKKSYASIVMDFK